MGHPCAAVLCDTPLPGHRNDTAPKELIVPENLDFFFLKFKRCYQRLEEVRNVDGFIGQNVKVSPTGKQKVF